MSNFGAGQNLFGAPANQNKDQNPSNTGSTPAAGGGLFGNLGANTTSSTAFGGAGAGGASAGSGTGGGFPGPGGGVFGGGGNANAPNPAGAGANTGGAFGGAGLFAREHTSYSTF